ncbi:hypothetical protein B7463_g2193, partial [Scytalidium lignicola]
MPNSNDADDEPDSYIIEDAYYGYNSGQNRPLWMTDPYGYLFFYGTLKRRDKPSYQRTVDEYMRADGCLWLHPSELRRKIVSAKKCRNYTSRMTTILANALLQGTRAFAGHFTGDFGGRMGATGLTGLTGPTTPEPVVTSLTDPPIPLTQELQARIEAVRNETLEYHRTHRPLNTTRNYAPKQKEWKTWYIAQGFPPGGQYLPVTSRPPRKGTWLMEEKERKRKAGLQGLNQPFKRQKKNNNLVVNAGNHLIVEGEDDEEQSELVLMYNTVCGATEIVKPNLAANGFLELLDKLRDVFLQVSYAVYGPSVEAVTDILRHEDLHLVAIEKAIPSATHVKALAEITGALNELADKLDDFLTGSFSLTFTLGRSRMLPQGYDPTG